MPIVDNPSKIKTFNRNKTLSGYLYQTLQGLFFNDLKLSNKKKIYIYWNVIMPRNEIYLLIVMSF